MVDATGAVVVIGDALIDEFRTAAGSEDFVGGAALNVAVGLARLGVPTTLVAMVGDDSDGDVIRAFLAEHRVTLLAHPGALGTARAISDRTDGEPRYHFSEAARERFVSFDERALAAISAAPYVVVSCLRFDSAEQAALLERAVAEPERHLVIDPNPRAGMLHSAEDFVANFERIAASALLVKIGDDDAELLYGEQLETVTERLLDLGARTVLSTAGRAGASIATDAGERVHEPIAALPGPVVDTMGGGDSTLASVVASLVGGAANASSAARTGAVESGAVERDAVEWDAVLSRAMAVAAATVRSRGALLQLPDAR